MTIKPIAKGMSAQEFKTYVDGDVTARMGAWRPRGVVLHNTAAPTLAQFYKNKDKPLSGEQRVKNMWVSYERAGWAGGPHLVVTDREILLGNPLWLRGTHSPSWNATFWGLEMAGDFDKEALPPALRDNAVQAMAALYAMLGHEPDNNTFHFHKEDPRTTHKGCPGKNAGVKANWIEWIQEAMAKQHPGGCQCAVHTS